MDGRRSLVLLFLICALVVSPTFAQTPTPATPPAGLTAGDVQAIQDTAKSIGVVFGIEKATPTPAVQTGNNQAPAEHQKTVADVADKAVDMVGRLVASAAQTLQKVAPDVWRILIKQQYAKAIGDLTIPFGLLLSMLVLNQIYFKKTRKITEACQGQCKEHSSDAHGWMWTTGTGLPVVGFVVSILWTLISLSNSIKFLINPEFYAIRDLLMMLLNKGQTM